MGVVLIVAIPIFIGLANSGMHCRTVMLPVRIKPPASMLTLRPPNPLNYKHSQLSGRQ
jgi:hypothetical protein